MISVIIPVHNTEKYIDRCVQSVLANTYKELEIILVENGSTDRSLEICRMYEKDYANVKVIVADQTGISHARNLGMDAAEGEYIAFLDSDDYVSPHMYRKLLCALTEDIHVSFCACRNGAEWNCEWTNNFDEQRMEVNTTEYLHSAYVRGKTEYLAVWNKLYRTSFLQSKQIYFNEDLTFSEDREFVTRCAVFARKMIFVNDPLYYYYRRINGSTCQTMVSFRSRCDQVFSGVMSATFIEERTPHHREWLDYIWACVLEEANFWQKRVKRNGDAALSNELCTIIRNAKRNVWKAKGLSVEEKCRYLLGYYAPWLFRKIYRVYKFVKR